ncbi:hypothetical protein VNO77_41001 [Canavalia gladiata]|uniref:Uncharacterized protein n=1 Tax=Canavalia gladiata TaxID=3824 RepID=A0AAN9K184_CANGL
MTTMVSDNFGLSFFTIRLANRLVKTCNGFVQHFLWLCLDHIANEIFSIRVSSDDCQAPRWCFRIKRLLRRWKCLVSIIAFTTTTQRLCPSDFVFANYLN